MTRNRLFEWLQVDLWNKAFTDCDISRTEFHELIQFASKQSVHGHIANVAVRNNKRVNKYVKFESLYVADIMHKENRKLDILVAEVANGLEKHNINYVIVKGQTTERLYPHKNVRAFGDIDIYVHPDDKFRIGQVFKDEWNIELTPFSRGKHRNAEMKGVEIEVHHRLCDFKSAKHGRYWEHILLEDMKEKRYVEIGGTNVRVLSPMMKLIYTFMHLFFHLILFGIGLRQFIDIGVIIHRYRSEIDTSELEARLKGLGVYDAFCAVGWIIINRLGLPEDEFPFRIEEKHKKYEKRLLDEVFYRGNFGKYGRKYNTPGIMHTLETIHIMSKHTISFGGMAPREIGMMIPRTIAYDLHLDEMAQFLRRKLKKNI